MITVLLTAKDNYSREDRLFLVSGANDGECMMNFKRYVVDFKFEVGIDSRTVKYLGDGPESSVKIDNPWGITELDTSNNCGYSVSVVKDDK